MHLLLVMDLEEGRWYKNVEWEGCPRVGDEICVVNGVPPVYSVVEKVSWGFNGEPRAVCRPMEIDPLDLYEDRGWEKARAVLPVAHV